MKNSGDRSWITGYAFEKESHSSSPPLQAPEEVDSPAFPAGTEQSSVPTPNVLPRVLGGTQNLSKRRGHLAGFQIQAWQKIVLAPPTTDPYPQEPQGARRSNLPSPSCSSRHLQRPAHTFTPLTSLPCCTLLFRGLGKRDGMGRGPEGRSQQQARVERMG